VGEGDTAANSVFLAQGPSIAAPLSTKELPLSFRAADFGSGREQKRKSYQESCPEDNPSAPA